MTSDVVTYELRGKVALIGLNRADKRNAINEAVLNGLSEAAIRAGEEARVGVLFGHGKNFSAGLDLAWLAERIRPGAPYQTPYMGSLWHRTFNFISRGPIPFLAALHGPVIGGGLELASATHIRVASETAVFGLPEGQRGIFVGGGGTVWVLRIVGNATMTDMMLTGRILNAEEARGVRIAQYVVPEGTEQDKAIELAERIAENTPTSNWQITNVLPRMNDLSHDDGLFMEFMNSNMVKPPETMGRLSAFLEGKSPLPLGDKEK
jgi:enoyl-CoA hydratase/carnithine racemase